MTDKKMGSRRAVLKAGTGLAMGGVFFSGGDANAGTSGEAEKTAATCAQQGDGETNPFESARAFEDITKETIAEAEKLHGIRYSDDERLSIVETYEGHLEGLKALRSVAMPNEWAPAQVFDPRLPGTAYRSQENKVVLGGETRTMPDGEEIAFASVADIGAWLRAGKITSERLTELYLARIERIGPRLECFVTVTAEIARAQARQADRELSAGQDKGPLHGIPYVMKDIIDVAGVRATWGAAPYKDRVAKHDAAVVHKLRDAGAVLLGKSTSGAIAYGDRWFGGLTRNPWNPKEGSSGSSAGSASATAAGLCAFSIGTETLGSIVSPSNRCGATGLRPTFGRVSRAGAMALCWSLDKIGPICRYAEDTALVLAAINGYDVADASSIGHGFAYDGTQSLKGMRVGFDPVSFEEANDVEKGALEAVKSLGVNLVETRFPADLPINPLLQVVEVEAAAAFEELTLSNRDDEMVWQADRAWPNTWRRARLYSAVDYVQVDRLRRQVMQGAHEMFSGIDAFIGPNFAGFMLRITNFTGQPCMALKAGFVESITRQFPSGADADTETTYSVPQTISLWAPLFEEGNVVHLGSALENALSVARRHPDL